MGTPPFGPPDEKILVALRCSRFRVLRSLATVFPTPGLLGVSFRSYRFSAPRSSGLLWSSFSLTWTDLVALRCKKKKKHTYFPMKNQRFHRSRYIDGVQTSFMFIKKFDLPVAAARRPTSELVTIT